jgi:hypothetical protein
MDAQTEERCDGSSGATEITGGNASDSDEGTLASEASAEALAASRRVCVACMELFVALSVLGFFTLRVAGRRIGHGAWAYLHGREARTLCDPAMVGDLELGTARPQQTGFVETSEPQEAELVLDLEMEAAREHQARAFEASETITPEPFVEASTQPAVAPLVAPLTLPLFLQRQHSDVCVDKAPLTTYEASETITPEPLAEASERPAVAPLVAPLTLPVFLQRQRSDVFVDKESSEMKGRSPFQDITNIHVEAKQEECCFHSPESKALSFKYAAAQTIAAEQFDLTVDDGEALFPKDRPWRRATLAKRQSLVNGGRSTERGAMFLATERGAMFLAGARGATPLSSTPRGKNASNDLGDRAGGRASALETVQPVPAPKQVVGTRRRLSLQAEEAAPTRSSLRHSDAPRPPAGAAAAGTGAQRRWRF